MHYGRVTISDGDDSDFELDLNSQINDEPYDQKYGNVQEFDDDVIDVDVIDVDTSKPDHNAQPEVEVVEMETGPANASYDLVVQSEVRDVTNFQESIATGRRDGEDDSAVSFGDKVAQTIGNWQYAPSAPSFDELLTEQEKREYEDWLRCTQISERKRYPRHKEWEKELQRAGSHPDFNPVLEPSDLPADTLSRRFKRKVMAALKGRTPPPPPFHTSKGKQDQKEEALDILPPGEEHEAMVKGVRPANDFSKYALYVPRTFQQLATTESDDEEEDVAEDVAELVDGDEKAWSQAHTTNYDEVAELMGVADNKYKVAWRNPAKNVIAEGSLWVVSDHKGQSTGKKLEVWGPGCKPRFQFTKGKRKGRVGEPLSLQTEYAHVKGRFTIVVIRPNELGFALNLKTYRLRVMLPGRYFVQEHYDNYIGKAPVTLGEATNVAPHSASTIVQEWAARLEVVCIATGHAAFCMAGDGIFVAPHRAEPYIIDKANDEAFLSMVKLSMRHTVCTCYLLPSQPTYHIVNLQPDEYVVLRDQYASSIVYRYNPRDARLNTLHIPSLYFTFDGIVHKITEGTKTINDVIVIKNDPQDFSVIRDPLGNLRFFESSTNDILVLRHPWQLVEKARAKAVGCTRIGEDGHQVARVILTPAEWAVIQLRSGEVKIFPPMLADGIPYYFYQPFHTLHGIANRFAHDEQTFELPGYKVTIVNLTTGELGACRIQNVNMFLNPRPLGPYVFVSPDEFLGKAPVVETHFQAGDLHYVRIQADERACVIRDGEAILLPTAEGASLAKENKGNGVYIFRARQHLEVIGPRKKTEESYSLGPWQFFNVPPGHVGYGTRHGKLHVWSEGQHSVNISNNEQFSGFFQINVDPVVAKDVEVMCKHAITSRLTITVTYMISDALKTIKCFGGDHPKLHRFINSLATSKILELCAKRPPMGFSEADFDPRKDQLSNQDMPPELVVATDQAKVSGELLTKLRQHPEVLRAGIHIGFAEIQEWKIDEAFMKSSKEIAMKLQTIHAVTERKRMELEQQKLDNARKVEEEKSAINETKLIMERERVKAETKKERAVILAQQEADTKRAAVEAEAAASVAAKEATLKQRVLEAECATELAKQTQEKELIVLEQNQQRAESQKKLAIIESQKKAAAQQAQAEANAAAAIAHKEAELKQKTLSAEADKECALQKQQQQEIENQTNVKQAEAQAMMRSAAMTAERMAKAKAEQEAAKMELAAAQTMLEASKLKAAAELEVMKARAQGEQLIAEAKVSSQFPGLSPQERAQCLLSTQMMETHREISKRTQQVYHTMDPEESQRVYEQQMRNMMGMSRSVAGFMGGHGGLNAHRFSLGNASMGLFDALHNDPFMGQMGQQKQAQKQAPERSSKEFAQPPSPQPKANSQPFVQPFPQNFLPNNA